MVPTETLVCEDLPGTLLHSVTNSQPLLSSHLAVSLLSRDCSQGADFSGITSLVKV